MRCECCCCGSVDDEDGRDDEKGNTKNPRGEE